MLNADTVWAAAVVEALNPDPLVRTRLVGYHASVGRLVALITLTPFGRTNDADSRVAPLTGRELPGIRGLYLFLARQ